jgi:uncharacterized cupin superfamily protein
MLALGCASSEPQIGEPLFTVQSAITVNDLVVYRSGETVPASQMFELTVGDFDGKLTVVEGDPTWAARVDYFGADTTIGGVLQATQGKFSIFYPSTSHITFHVGQATITDEEGPHVMKKGDSFLVKQGQAILWDVTSALAQVSFLGHPENEDNPGPLLIYPKNSHVPDDEFTEIDLAHFNATVIAGDPELGVRVDHVQGTASGGVFRQATEGTVEIDPVAPTQHGTIVRHKLQLTDSNGVMHELNHGDSFLVQTGAKVLWGSKQKDVQGNFYGFRP